ncbi:MAG: PTS sugar transporter subunit IIC [Actinomycetia bacterium]|nr:PTS sugar transporter subunit IIC [Actinomycetes bacterium]
MNDAEPIDSDNLAASEPAAGGDAASAVPSSETSTTLDPEPARPPNRLQAFLARKDIVFSVQRYAYDAFSALALGLFASLLIGTILNTAGTLTHAQFLIDTGKFASSVSGAAMAVAIGYALKAPPLVLCSLVAVGSAANQLGGAGAPLAVLFIAIIAAEFGKAVSKETSIDLIVTPLVTILVGVAAAWLLAPPIGTAASQLGSLVMWATELQPLLMGALVALIIGLALVMPTSSAAICAALGLTGLAGGAAVAGCCAQMVGFALISFRENRWGGLVSQGLGTAKLQMPNIFRNPRIIIPTLVVSAINGALAATVFQFHMDGPAIASGMGTSGLVGPIGVYSGWVEQAAAGLRPAISATDWLAMLLVCLVIPAVLSLALAAILRKLGWIRKDDLKIPL